MRLIGANPEVNLAPSERPKLQPLTRTVLRRVLFPAHVSS